MKNLIFIFIFISFIFTTNIISQTANAKSKKSVSNKSVKPRTIKSKNENKKIEDLSVCVLPPSVFDLELSQTEVVSDCLDSDNNCKKIIEVRTVAVDSRTESLDYVYKISGGKIIGEGANVKWDLSEVKTGIYKITAGISIPVWGISGKTITKAVTVKK